MHCVLVKPHTVIGTNGDFVFECNQFVELKVFTESTVRQQYNKVTWFHLALPVSEDSLVTCCSI